VIRLFHKPKPDQVLVQRDVAELGSIEDGWIWVDISQEALSTAVSWCKRFGFHELAIEDVVEPTKFPKVDDYGGYLFAVLHALSARDHRIDTVELHAFVGERYLLTVSHDPVPAVDWAVERGLATPAESEGGPDRMLARIAEGQSRRYLPVIDELEVRLDDLEERSIQGDPSVLPEILALRRDVAALRRVVGPQREVLSTLRTHSSGLISDRARLRFADVHDHYGSLVESLDAARTVLQAVLEAYRSTQAERANEAMKVLTVFAAILLPLSLIAGIFGMNFIEMPWLRSSQGFWVVLSVMGVITIGEWIYFARRGFVGRFALGRLPRRVGSGLAHLATAPVRAVGDLVDLVAGKDE